MIIDNKRLIVYLNSTVHSVFKILPLYEEKNVGLKTYLDSLIFELDSLEEAIHIEHSHEYLSLLSTLKAIKKELNKDESKKPVIKREVFKCINVIKNMVGKLEEEV